MSDGEKKELIKRLYSKRGIETDLSVVMANLGLLQAENKALKARVKFLQDALDTAYEDDAAGYEALMEEIK